MKSVINLPEEFDATSVRLDGRTVLVVGADSDLGHSISRYLAGSGATLILQASKKRTVNDLYDAIAGAPGNEEPLIAEINLPSAGREELRALANGLGEQFSALHAIVYLPAPSAPLSPFEHCTAEHLQSALNAGVVQPLQLLQALLPMLKEASSPSVVLQSLAAGRVGKPYWTANGAATAARENLADTLAEEHDSIGFHTVDFGKTASALRHRAYPAEARSTLRECDDPDLLKMMLYLVSGAAEGRTRYILPDRLPANHSAS